MKVSIFDKDTGKFQIYGNTNSPKVADLMTAGHKWVEEKHSAQVMWDFNLNTAVPDPDWAAKQNQKAQDQQNWDDMRDFFTNTATVKQGNSLDADAVEAMFQALKGHFSN